MRAPVLLAILLLVAMLPPVPASEACPTGGPENDCFTGALPHFGKTLAGSTVGATTQPGEPPCSSSAQATKTVWYRATPRSTGTLRVALDAPWRSVLGVYSGSALSSLTPLGCDWAVRVSSTSWDLPQLDVACVADQPLWIQVGGQQNASSSFSLALSGCAFDATPPDPPAWCTATAPCPAAGVRQLDFAWDPPAWDGGELTQLDVYRVVGREGPCGSPPGAYYDVLLPAPEGDGVMTHVVEGLLDDTSYCFKVMVYNDAWLYAGTEWVTLHTAARPLPPTPEPAQVRDTLDVRVTIHHPYDDGNPHRPPTTAIHLYAAPALGGPYALVAELPPETQSWLHEARAPGERLCYRASAVNVVGESPLGSGALCAVVVGKPSAPTEMALRPTGHAGVDYLVTWKRPESAAGLEGYRIYYEDPLGERRLVKTESQHPTHSFVGIADGVLPGFPVRLSMVAFTRGGESEAATACYASQTLLRC